MNLNLSVQDMITVLNLISNFAVGIIGIFISYLLYRHYRQQRKDVWIRNFTELHEAFWNDKSMADVRSWMACEKSYLKIQPILAKRQKIANHQIEATKLSEKEYEELEKLDKFCNLLMRVVTLNPEFSSHKVLWKRLFADYWIEHIGKYPDLLWYVNEFYCELLEQRDKMLAENRNKIKVAN